MSASSPAALAVPSKPARTERVAGTARHVRALCPTCQRAGAAGVRAVPFRQPHFPDHFDTGGRAGLRRADEVLAVRRRHRPARDRACGACAERAVVDLYPPLSADAGLGDRTDRARPRDPAADHHPCRRHQDRRRFLRHRQQLFVGSGVALARPAGAVRRALVRLSAHRCDSDGVDPCLHRPAFLAAAQTLVCRVATGARDRRDSDPDAVDRRLHRRRKPDPAGRTGSRTSSGRSSAKPDFRRKRSPRPGMRSMSHSRSMEGLSLCHSWRASYGNSSTASTGRHGSRMPSAGP